MKRPSIASRLNPHLYAQNILQSSEEFEEIVFDPGTLLDGRRFDLFAKLIYARSVVLGLDLPWAAQLYRAHILAFNGGSEGDGSGKESVESFQEAFDELIASIQSGGFDPDRSLVPIGARNLVLDGAHRIAACAASGTPVTGVAVNAAPHPFDHQFFRARGLEERWTDAMAAELCRMNPRTFVVIIYPAAGADPEAVYGKLRDHGHVAYAKAVRLNRRGAINLVRQVYHGEPWLGSWEDGFAGAAYKADRCFSRRGPLHAFVIETDDVEAMRRAKEELREGFGVGNHSVHINDSHKETILLAGLLFNANSIRHLNSARLRLQPRFEALFAEYSGWMERERHDPERFCLDGSASLAAHGLRDARDLDYLHQDPDVESGIEGIDSHNGDAIHHAISRDRILWNPRFHFFYRGHKFVSLQTLRTMKVRRGEGKDRVDVRLIDRCRRTAAIRDFASRIGGDSAFARRLLHRLSRTP